MFHHPNMPLPLTVVILFTAVAESAWGQAGRRGGPMPNRTPVERPQRAPKATPKALDKMARRTAELDRFERMPPEQRQKALDRLSPERRQRIEQGLEQYRAMNPQNRERLLNFERMPAEQRDAVRQNFRRIQELPSGRRALVRKEMQQLRGMTDSERESRVQSEAFRKRFDANEQGLIRDTVANLPPGSLE
jgi:TolA-binding protein